MYPRLLQLGHIAIPTYGALTALGLIAGLAGAVHFARLLNLDPNRIWSLCLIGIFTTLAGARLLLVFSHLRVFEQHPFWILGLTSVHDEWIAAFSMLAGLAAAILYALAEGLPVLVVLDCLAPATALAMSINRAGAFLAGLNYGTTTTAPWAVVYTSPFAAMWYRTPLGIRLHPVQLYDAAASLMILALAVWRLPRRSQDGELAGAWLFLFGLSSFFLSFFRAATAAFSLTQWIAIAAVIAGGALWLQRTPRERRASAA